MKIRVKLINGEEFEVDADSIYAHKSGEWAYFKYGGVYSLVVLYKEIHFAYAIGICRELKIKDEGFETYAI